MCANSWLTAGFSLMLHLVLQARSTLIRHVLGTYKSNVLCGSMQARRIAQHARNFGVVNKIAVLPAQISPYLRCAAESAPRSVVGVFQLVSWPPAEGRRRVES